MPATLVCIAPGGSLFLRGHHACRREGGATGCMPWGVGRHAVHLITAAAGDHTTDRLHVFDGLVLWLPRTVLSWAAPQQQVPPVWGTGSGAAP